MTSIHDGHEKTRNERLLAWIDETAARCKPDRIHWRDGSQEEYDTLWEELGIGSETSERGRKGVSNGPATEGVQS